ncbi:hypothetical protein ABZ746_29475 [Streptomyces sp. NPDC020096]
MNFERSCSVNPAARVPILLDVSIRDGGYVIGHSWTVDEAVSIVRAVAAAGVPFVEVGYLRTATGNPASPATRCEPDYLGALAAEARHTRLVVMVRPGEVSPESIKGLARQGVGMVRVLAARLDVAKAAPYLAAARAEGLVTAVNLTHASRFGPAGLGRAVREAAEAGADIVYLADSNGSLYPEDVAARVSAAVSAAESTDGRPLIGFHPHDNLGLAFANTCAALDSGARAVDASIGGIGKGGGNLRLELIAAHLTVHTAADFSVDPLLRDHSAHAAKSRMIADTSAGTVMAGLLDISLDQSRRFQEAVDRHGYDALLRGGVDFRSPAVLDRA